MSTVSHDTSREMATQLTDATKAEWSSFLHSTNSLCFSSARLVTRDDTHDPVALPTHSNLPASNPVNSAASGRWCENQCFSVQ